MAAIPDAAPITITGAAFAPFPGPAPTGVRGAAQPAKEGVMLTPAALLTLAGQLTGAAADDDAASLAAIAWLLYGEAGENRAEIGRLRAAIHAAWTRPHEPASPAPAAA